MGAEDIALKLKLDASDAKDEVSTVSKYVDKFSKSFQTMGREMESSMTGRLLKGVIGTFANNFEYMLDETLPAAIRQSKLEVELAGALSNALIEGTGDYAEMLARMSQGRPGRVREGAWNAWNQLTGNGMMPIEDEKSQMAIIKQMHENEMTRAESQSKMAQSFSRVHKRLASENPEYRVSSINPDEIARQAAASGALDWMSGWGDDLWRIPTKIDQALGLK